jgi:membrane-bound metal-dependent hydrolase YbcI (DUF457 family)
MFIGHFAVGIAAKRFAPRTSLGWLLGAALFLDLIWPLLVIAGIESVRIEPGNTAFTPLDFVSYPWSHSLLMTLVWSVLLAAVFHWKFGDWAGTLAVGVAVASHWLLDFISHRPDLPLTPGFTDKVGLGLWNHVVATAAVEIAMLMVALVLYARITRPANRTGQYSYWSFVALLALLYAGAIRGDPPPNVAVLMATALSAWLAVWWAASFDRNRVVR